jgi:serine protease
VVYRFNGIPGVGPDSHFFTRDRAECSIVNKTAKWSLEGVPFVASAPNVDGSCDMLSSVYPAERRVPLYRAWRPFGDSNHRFTTDRAVIAQMVAQGWVDEGAAMCVLPPL